MKKKTTFIVSLCAVALLAAGCSQQGAKSEKAADSKPTETVTPQTNLYEAVNHDWIAEAEIPSDKPATNAFSDIQKEIDDQLKADLEKMAKGELKSDIRGMDDLMAYYKSAMNIDLSNKEGTQPVQDDFKQVEAISSIQELADKQAAWFLTILPQPFSISVGINPKETTKKQIDLSGPGLFLIDTSYYADAMTKKQIGGLFEESSVKVMTRMGYSKKEAQALVEKAMAFDEKLVPYTLSSEEASDSENTINVRSSAEIAAYSSVFKLDEVVNTLVKQEVAEVNVSSLKFFEHIDELLNDDNLEEIKAWLLVSNARSNAALLDEETREAAASFNLALNGVEEMPAPDEQAYQSATKMLSEPLSVYYGEKYMNKADVKAVEDMVDSFIAVYKDRLGKNDWLSAATKQKAIEKLDAITTYIGATTEVDEVYDELEIDGDKSFYEASTALVRWLAEREYAEYSEPVDKDIWVAPAFQVNAFYAPTNNSITFPAAILNAPFYSSDQDEAANYGGIGAVIAHEITHAFDNNGAEYDKEGNRKEWWTKEDYAAFEAKTQLVVKQWDGIEINGGKVNGQLTVGENIADAGGLSTALEAFQKKNPDADLKPFFEGWASVWRLKVSPEYSKLLLTVDTHAPNELRANMNVKNLDAFYDTYDVQEDDDMYLPEAERISFW